MEEAVAEGRDPEEVRQVFGSMLRQREASRRVRVSGWLDGLRADVIFGWRQLRRNRVTSAAAILSLALAMGACVSAFRLIDALLWRPLPVAAPERLFAISRAELSFEGKPTHFDGWAYPDFVLMRAAAKGQAELVAVSDADHMDLTFASDAEMEKGLVQYVSGWMWESFGLHPTLGRLFTEQDDKVPGAHPVAVLSYDYWSRRFVRDPKVIGRTVRMGDQLLEIVGVGPKSFTGTEPGTLTEIFLPTMMHRWVTRDDSTWHRTLAVIPPGTGMEPLRAKLDAVNMGFESERAKGFTGMPQQSIDNYLRQRVEFLPAATGVSGFQADYREALEWLGVLVVLVLADCVRECGQPDDRTGDGAGTRDGVAGIDWGGTLAAGADGAGGERDAVWIGRWAWRHVCVEGGAAGVKHDQFSGQSGAADLASGLAGAGIRGTC